MPDFQPPPTWAEPVLIDIATKKAKFNPIWLKWFLDLVQVLNETGGTSINHNSTDSIQGGSASERYHLTAAQQAKVASLALGTLVVQPTQPDGAAQTAVTLYAGTGAPDNGDGADGDFYFRGDGTVAGDTVIYHKEGGTWIALTTT